MNSQTKTLPEYGEEYFKSINYVDYLDRERRYHQTAHELYSVLNKIGLLTPQSHVLDYGCALGFLVSGFRKLGLSCEGFDISDWARVQAHKRGVKYIDFEPAEFDLISVLDVFEHMSDIQIVKTLITFTAPAIVVRIPVSTDSENFHLEISRRDPTHINCKTKAGWLDLMARIGYRNFLPFNLYTVYDSPGVMAGVFLK